ncbi:hypothetical protein JTE90_011552 [Oedothorax gibbosus]|uniref:Uncharacterized protein n=1 Tax=Oedothorax gibbosus TaxID=931172 RepID=A0AAV6UKL5_9ARAC|nr:hypothetical protein JTE90_011552 [Oedothorax gibbosus]
MHSPITEERFSANCHCHTGKYFYFHYDPFVVTCLPPNPSAYEWDRDAYSPSVNARLIGENFGDGYPIDSIFVSWHLSSGIGRDSWARSARGVQIGNRKDPWSNGNCQYVLSENVKGPL